MAVERVNYFTGLLLDESDFKLEQNYHVRMRRMLNFGLFMPGILFGLGVDREAPDRVSVERGMAIDRDERQNEGREIVLTESRTLTLNTFDTGEPINNGDQVYIAISHQEGPTTPREPLNRASRITEEAVIELIKPAQDAEPTGSGFPEDQNLKIILAKVMKGDFSGPDLSERQFAQLRLGAQGPTVTRLIFSDPPRPDSEIEMTIHGANLADDPRVEILDTANNRDLLIKADITGASSNTVLKVNLVIDPDAILADRRVRVRTALGTVTTAPQGDTAFKVIPPAPVIDDINPKHGRQTVTVPNVTITGRHFAANPPEVSILPNEGDDGGVKVTGVSVNADGTSISATLEITPNAAPGGRRVRVEAAGGAGESEPNLFTVRPRPRISQIVPQLLPADGQEGVVIIGSDILGNVAIGQPAEGTIVRLFDPENPNNVELGENIIVRADTPQQQEITLKVPPRGDLPRNVQVTLEIEGAISDPEDLAYQS